MPRQNCNSMAVFAVTVCSVFTTNGAFGLTKKATYITISNGAPNGTKSHELYHTTGVLDNGYDKGGILNRPPEKISSDEVDMMWNLIPFKK